MSDWSPRDATRFAAALIQASRAPLAALASRFYARDGRGTLAITVRGSRPDTIPELRALQIGYWSVERYRALTAAHTTGSVRACADDLMRRMHTYEPATQFVVAVVVGPQFLTIPFTVPLDAPVWLDEAAGVH